MKIKQITYILSFTLFISFTFQGFSQIKKDRKSVKYAKTIMAEELKEKLYVYASDEFEGRGTPSKGQELAIKFLEDHYVSNNISPLQEDNYFQVVPPPKRFEKWWGKSDIKPKNVVAYIEGDEHPDEYIILSAHLDHVGMEDGEIFNGADDDGSGTVALLEIAEAFKEAANNGHGPNRSIVFLHVTAEEMGLIGSKYYTDNPIVPLKNTVTNLNVDMIGRTDPQRPKRNREYIYIIGSDKISQELHDINEEVNNIYLDIDLDYIFNAEDHPDRFYYRSDHYNFAKKGVPIIFYFSGTHEDYHQPTDTVEKIQYDLLELRTRLIFHTAWELANRDDRIKID
jgi:Zn-dependent M28 family amino/carboxypeptidase